ncbi:hypothetical protein [Candidatus Palauibacter sp.]|uniref:hypothetical protein n=1 Tax=Candidatus Palauibacter sp. TaxID=3101350 RepID=UPI003C6EC4B0
MRQSILLLGMLVISAGLEAQTDTPKGMIMEEGEWRVPTPVTALRALRESPGSADAVSAAIAVLRQKFESRPIAELDAFAEELAQLMREDSGATAIGAGSIPHRAGMVMKDASEGVPYTGAKDAFVRLYESYDDRTSRGADMALFEVFRTGGEDYVRELFDASEERPPCSSPVPVTDAVGRPVLDSDGRMILTEPENPCPNATTWCQAGLLLLSIGEGPDPMLWRHRCQLQRGGSPAKTTPLSLYFAYPR